MFVNICFIISTYSTAHIIHHGASVSQVEESTMFSSSPYHVTCNILSHNLKGIIYSDNHLLLQVITMVSKTQKIYCTLNTGYSFQTFVASSWIKFNVVFQGHEKANITLWGSHLCNVFRGSLGRTMEMHARNIYRKNHAGPAYTSSPGLIENVHHKEWLQWGVTALNNHLHQTPINITSYTYLYIYFSHCNSNRHTYTREKGTVSRKHGKYIKVYV